MARRCCYRCLESEYSRAPLHYRKSNAGPAVNHTTSKKILWIHGCYNASWVFEELGKTYGYLCADNECSAFVALLRACAKNKDLYRGTRLHHDALKRGLLEKCSDALVTMYAKCGALTKAQELLDMRKSRDVFSWTDLIAGYAHNGQGQDALNCFEKMLLEGLSPDAVTYACILKACGSIRAADKGEQVHDEVARQGLLTNNIVVGTALVDMYAKCGALVKAQQVLDELPVRNVVSWTALITGYAQEGKAKEALSCFERMQREGLSPDAVTFLCILTACGSIGATEKGEQVHQEIARQGLLGNDRVLGNALVDMYVKCGALSKARQVLEELPVRDVIAWSALITGYVQQGQGEQALSCFEQMLHEGLSPNAVTFLCILKACGSIGAADKGRKIHDEIARQGLLGEDVLLGTALVDMYAKCGALTKAQRVLKELPIWSVVSWNALIAGYAQHGQGEQALSCFEQMQREGFSPNAVTLMCILKACGSVGLIDSAETCFWNMSTKFGITPHLEHYTCIVDVLGRAGHLDKAVEVVKKMPSFDASIALWSALLGACQKWGDVDVGRWAFEQAIQEEKCEAAAYVLMTKVYTAAGMCENAKAMIVETKA